MPKTVGLIPERKDMAVLARFYNVAGIKIRGELQKISFDDFRELEADKMQRKTNAIIRNMDRFAIRWSKKSIKDAYVDSMLIAKISLAVLGAEKDPFFNKKTHINAVRDAQDLIITDFIKANNSIKMNITTYLYLARKAFQGMSQVQAFDLRDEEVIAGLLDDSIRAGASRGQLDMLIRKHFERDLWERKFININGRNYNLVSYAKMVSRTRLRTVQSEAVKNECKEFGNDLVRISNHGTTCKICIPFEGKVFSISGTNLKYSLILKWPPFHPNCQHSANPTSEAAIEWEKEWLKYKPYEVGTAGAKQTTTLNDSLKKLPRRHVMRVEKYSIDTTKRIGADVPAFKGKKIAGYWSYADKGVHINSLHLNDNIIFHEVGHAAWDTGIVPYSQKPLWGSWFKKAEQHQIKFPSVYSLTNEGEFFAECYSNYYQKKYNLIDNGIKKWFDKTFKGGL